jgi:CBS-domain-containing membrane protein
MLTKRQRHSDGVVMKRSVLKMIEEFRLYWKHYVLQSLFATVAVLIVLYFLSLQNAVIIASIGATAFIVFAMPDYVTAQPRNVIGGHLVGLFWGLCFP